jgi:dipeptidase D
MSAAMPGLVETSTNLASVKFAEDKIVITTSQRSSVESAKEYAKLHVESAFVAAGCEVVHSDGYPGWAPNPNSTLLECTKTAYQKLFGSEPKVRAIHAGLECGLFLEKYPHLEMVSFGPTLRGVHSPDERLEIATVDKFWKLLVEVVGTIK